MITKVKIQGYRIYRDLILEPKPGFNLVVGANETGKSTLLEALSLGLTGRINGRAASEELNPFWFNAQMVADFISECRNGKRIAWPEIRIELFLEDRDDLQQLCGAVNSDVPTRACPGVVLCIRPHPDYEAERQAWVKEPCSPLPVEYYKVDWRSFADEVLTSRPKQLATAVIDSRTVRSSSGVDYHMRSILSDGLEPAERASISVAYRKVKAQMSEGVLKSVNDRISGVHASLHDEPIHIAMDQSARTTWEGAVVPHVSDIPFSMSGQGQQAAIKISLAMNRSSARVPYVMIEEPENHLTHTSLSTLLSRISDLAGQTQQLFISTHSSFVLNRLGLDGLHLLGGKTPLRLTSLQPDVVAYFQKLPGYDTLRMALAKKLVLVEGPSDEIIFERIFRDLHGKTPMACGVDVLSMRGLSLRKCLTLCAALGKTVAALRDNDGASPVDLRAPLDPFLEEGRRQIFVGDPEHGTTLEPQLRHFNTEAKLREILGVSSAADLALWMGREKTEGALRIAAARQSIVPPQYMVDAAKFIHA